MNRLNEAEVALVKEKMTLLRDTLKTITGRDYELVLLGHKVHEKPDEKCEGVMVITGLPLDDTLGMIVTAADSCAGSLMKQKMVEMVNAPPPGTEIN